MNHPRLFEVAVNVPVQIIPPHHTLFFSFLSHTLESTDDLYRNENSALCIPVHLMKVRVVVGTGEKGLGVRREIQLLQVT